MGQSFVTLQGRTPKGQYEGMECAVKIYCPGQVEQRIERELEALNALSCDSVVDLTDC